MTTLARVPVRGNPGACVRSSHRAVVWGMIDVNPAKVGVDNPQPRRKEQRPFESWAELEAVAASLGPRYGPMVLFAAATGLRPGGVDRAREARRRPQKRASSTSAAPSPKRELKCPKTEASVRAVPLQASALDALDATQARRRARRCCFPAERGGYLDLHHFRTRQLETSPARRRRSSRSGGSTISGTPSRPSRSVPASPPSTSPATWAPA